MHKAVKILRLLANTIDSDEKEIFLYEGEDLIAAAPVLRVFETNDKYVQGVPEKTPFNEIGSLLTKGRFFLGHPLGLKLIILEIVKCRFFKQEQLIIIFHFLYLTI